MSNFEEWFLSNGIPLDTDFNVAKRAFEAGQQSQQAKIDELQLEAINVNNEFYANGQKSMRKIMQGRVDELQARIDELKITQNNLELKAEDAECVSMSLDDQGVAKCDDDGKPYSLWGRVCQFKKSNNITECDLERIYWEFDQERKNSGGERVVFKNTLRSLLNNLKGNKDE